MTPDTRAAITEALAPYGAELADGDRFVTPGGKVLQTRIEVRKGRVHMVDTNGTTIASYPLQRAATGVADFVEKFWFWKRREPCACIASVMTGAGKDT